MTAIFVTLHKLNAYELLGSLAGIVDETFTYQNDKSESLDGDVTVGLVNFRV